MRILFVAPWVPSRVRPRSLELLRHLSSVHQVYFVGLRSSDDRVEDIQHLPLAGAEIVGFSKFRGATRAFFALLFSGESLQAAYVSSRRLREAAREVVADFKPDLIYKNVVRSARMIDESTLPVIFDLDEIRSDYYLNLMSESTSLFWRLVGRIESSRMQKLESDVLSTSDIVLFSSPIDVERVQRRATLVRSLPDRGFLSWPKWFGSPDGLKLLFVGRMSFRANRESLVWFVKSVYAPLRRDGLRVTLRIVGEGADSFKPSYSDGISNAGYVSSLEGEYATADVCIVPVFLGTGVQMKLIQALAAGLPTITTSTAAMRAGVTGGQHVYVADSADEWQAAVREAVLDRRGASVLAKRGQAWARAHYSASGILGSLDSAIAPFEPTASRDC